MSITGPRALPTGSALALRNVSAMVGNARLLDKVSFDLPAGEMHFLVGPTGAGKSTILRCIAGLDAICGGELQVDDLSISAGNCRWFERSPGLRHRIGLVFQDGRLLQRFTVFDNIALALRCGGMSEAEVQVRVHAVANQLNLESLLGRRCDGLSGGQRQKVAIARALVLQPKLLLLDEVTNGLDPIAVGRLTDVLLAVNATGVTLLLVSHQIHFATDFGKRIHFVSDGRILWSGAGGDLWRDPPSAVAEFCAAIKKGW